MKDFKNFVGIALAVVIIWYVKEYFSSKTKISGIFQEIPAVGYSWNDGSHSSHFFWESANISWRPGSVHPDFNVQAAANEGKWVPLPGYKFANDKENDLTTDWTPGLLHPDYKVISDTSEHNWRPVFGYEFNDTDTKNLAVHWVPGLKDSTDKLISYQDEGKYIPFPGYSFKHPEENLEVVWMPGLTNPDNPNLISATTEGDWISNTEPSAADHVATAGLIGLASAVFGKLFGEGDVTHKLNEEAGKELIKGAVKALQ